MCGGGAEVAAAVVEIHSVQRASFSHDEVERAVAVHISDREAYDIVRRSSKAMSPFHREVARAVVQIDDALLPMRSDHQIEGSVVIEIRNGHRGYIADAGSESAPRRKVGQAVV